MLNFKQFSSLFAEVFKLLLLLFDQFLRHQKELKNREFSRLSSRKESNFAFWTCSPPGSSFTPDIAFALQQFVQ